MSTEAQYIPTADKTRTLDDGRVIQLAVEGVPMPLDEALRQLGGEIEEYAITPASGSVTVTLADYEPPGLDTASEGEAPALGPNGPNLPYTVTYAAAALEGTGLRHAIHQIDLSYSDTPTGGNLQIEDGLTAIFSRDIEAAGDKTLLFDPPLLGTAETGMVITLAAGGVDVEGVVAVRHTVSA